MISIQKYVRTESLEEAYRLNQSRANRVIGGMLWIKTGKGSVNTAIDLCSLGLDGIEETEEEFVIGAMTSLRQIELHQGLNAYTQGAAEAAVRDIVGVQFRNLATVGGSIWGRFGFSDVLTLFLSMETFVELYKGGILPLEQFAAMAYDRDILVRLIVKKKPGMFAYRAFRNQRTDLPVITCALSQMAGEYRAVVGARPGRAVVVRDEEGLLSGILAEGEPFGNEGHSMARGHSATGGFSVEGGHSAMGGFSVEGGHSAMGGFSVERRHSVAGESSLEGGHSKEAFQVFSAWVAEKVPVGSNTRGSAAYRTRLIRVLTERNLMQLGGTKDGD